jgi:hypothetical protein
LSISTFYGRGASGEDSDDLVILRHPDVQDVSAEMVLQDLYGERQSKKGSVAAGTFLLSKLKSIAAWRGDVVDYVISERIVPTLRKNYNLNLTRIIEDAGEIFNKQLEFASQHRLRELEFTTAKAGEALLSSKVNDSVIELHSLGENCSQCSASYA